MVSKYNENVIAMVCEIIAEIDGKKCLLPMRGYSVHFENAELIPVTAKICREHKFHIEEIRDKSFILVKNK